MVYYGREYEEEKWQQKRNRQKIEAPTINVRYALNSLRKNVQRDSGEKGWSCYHCGKDGHLKRDCPQASKPPLAPFPVCKWPHWRRDCPLSHRSQELGSQGNQNWRYPGVPTQTPILITPEELWVLITVEGQSVNFLLDTGATFSVLTEDPGSLSSGSTIVMGLSGRAKCYCFSHPLSFNWDSVIFSHKFHARFSLTLSGNGYTEQGPGLCFHKYGTCPFPPINWIKFNS